MHLRIVRPFLQQQLLYRLHDSQPHRPAFHVTGLHKLVGAHGGFNVGHFAVLLNKLIGGAEDVEVGGHLALQAAFEGQNETVQRLLAAALAVVEAAEAPRAA